MSVPSTDESFTIRIDTKEALPRGAHVLTIKAEDAVGNAKHKTLDVVIE